MNFYDQRHDERLHNKPVQLTYTADYVCFMHSDQKKEGATFEECFLRANHIDYDAVNQLVAEDFAVSSNDWKHHAHSARYLISQILGDYFPTSTRKQKVRCSDGRLLPKYAKWPTPLPNVQCRMKQAELIPLPTLPLDEAVISETIDILKHYIKGTLELEDHVVQNTCIMFKGGFLTVRNVRRAIYRRHAEPLALDRFEYIEPIAGLFHLQMNVLKLFLGASWGKKDNCVSLARFKVGLGRNNVSRDAKDFHACDDFYKTVVKSFAISLCMHGAGSTNVATFKTWLSQNNWRKLIQDVEETYLGALEPAKKNLVFARTLRKRLSVAIEQEKKDWLAKRARDRGAGITTTFMREPIWDKMLEARIEQGINDERDLVRENALRLLNLGLLYLDFVDACRNGYSGRIEKYIQLFAMVFQGSAATNYAGECLHLVACLKRVWKPEFRCASIC